MKFHCITDYISIPLERGKRLHNKRYRYSDESFEVEGDSIKELFQKFQEQHGRCVNKVFVSLKEKDIQIGWVFEKKEEYEHDSFKSQRQFYIQETWVSLHDFCEECSGRGHLPHEIVHPPWPPEEQECSSPENSL